jgi:cytochrome c oxidase subunit 3
MSRRWLPTGDVSELPDYAFGATTMGYWGVIGFMLIEGMAFVLAIGAYFYLRANELEWPPHSAPPPLLWGSVFTAVALLSEIPNTWTTRRAKAQDLRGVKIGMVAMIVFGLALVVVRGLEMHAMNVRWDVTAYGSIVWAILALHAFHTVTDLYDSGVLAAIVFRKPMDGRRFSDVADNALYWRFIVWSWVALYLVVYWTPRWT